MPGQHAKLSPSKAYQWSACSASVALIEDLIAQGRIPVESESSEWAAQGTARHDKAAKLLLGQAVELTPEETWPIEEYVKCCREVAGGAPLFVELKVPLFYSKEETGTLDFGCIREDLDTLFIRDYKDGMGVEEVGLRNKQLATYAISFIEYLVDLDLLALPSPGMKVNMGIIQPNFRGGYFGPSIWEISYKELLEFAAAEILPGHEEVTSGNGVFRPDPDEACVFCRAQKMCKAYERHLLGDLPELDDLTSNTLVPVEEAQKALPSVDALTDDQIARFLQVADPLVKWLNAVKEHAHEEILNGREVPGWKLVQGREGNRAWKDEAQARKLLLNYLSADEITEKSLISPTQASKLLKAHKPSTKFNNLFDASVSRSEGKPTLVRASDPRPAISAAAALADMPDVPADVVQSQESANPLD